MSYVRGCHKRRPAVGENLSNADKRGLQMRTSALLVQKNLGFFEIYAVCSHEQGEVNQCRHL